MTSKFQRTYLAIAVGFAFCGSALAQTATTGDPAATSGTAVTATSGTGTTTATGSTTATASTTTTGGTTTATGGTASPTTTTATPTNNAGRRIASSFASFAGSDANAAALVDGLRTGNTITLSDATASGGSVSFVPPTKSMGYGNIRIALSLAQAELAQRGITQPTPQQLATALMGTPSTGTAGSTTPTGSTATTAAQGVLQLRASGMGWGKIAHTLGVQTGNGRAGMTASAPATTVSYGGGGSGIVTAAGAAPTAATGSVGRGAGAAAASGTVSAAGSNGNGRASAGNGHAHGKS